MGSYTQKCRDYLGCFFYLICWFHEVWAWIRTSIFGFARSLFFWQLNRPTINFFASLIQRFKICSQLLLEVLNFVVHFPA